MSITVCWNACPMCSVPVTFGGGSRMQYGSPWPDGWNAPLASQRSYHFDSIWAGSKLFSIGTGLSGARGARFAWGKAVIVRGGGWAAKKGWRPEQQRQVRQSVWKALQQLDPEPPNQLCEQPEAHHGDRHAGEQRRPEAQARQQQRKGQEHRQRRHDVPECVPGVVGDLRLRLVLDVQPDQCQNSDQRQRGKQAAEAVAALGDFGDEHDDGRGD